MKDYGPQNSYHKNSMTSISVRFHNKNDADIIDALKSQPSQVDYLRRLIRADIEGKRENMEMGKRYTIYSTDNKGMDWDNEWFQSAADTEEEAIKIADELHRRYKDVYREKSSLVVVWRDHDSDDGEIVYVTDC